MIEVDYITLPAFLASALVNGDTSGLERGDLECLDAINARLARDGFEVVDVARDDDGDFYPRFTWSFRLYGGDAEGGEVLDYVVHKRSE